LPIVEAHKDGCILHVLVVPNAKKSEIVGVDNTRDRLKVKVKAPPVEGRANDELVKFLSKLFNTKIELTVGKKSRKKDLLVIGKSKEEVERILKLNLK
jgi:hypothetical protein